MTKDCIGPEKWGEICDGAYVLCGSGLRQSPIDIDLGHIYAQEFTPSGVPIRSNYKATDATMKNTGRGVEIEAAMGTMYCGDDSVQYNAVAVHFHSPSEHTRKGEHFPLELQIVHQRNGTKDASDLVIISFLFTEAHASIESSFLSAIGSEIPTLKEFSDVKGLNLNLLHGLQGSYISYEGSISTPPCTESVQHHVMSVIQGATAEQLNPFKDALARKDIGNARPVQPVAGRVVEFVDVSKFVFDEWKPSLEFTNDAAAADHTESEMVDAIIEE